MYEVIEHATYFTVRTPASKVLEIYTFNMQIANSKENAKKRADDHADRMNELWSRVAA